MYVRTVGFRMWMVSPEASQFFMRKISRRSCCDWYNCVGFYVTDENTKIRAIAKEGVINRGISPICSCACRPKRRLSILTCRTCVTHESTHNNLVVVTRIMRTRCVMPAARGPLCCQNCLLHAWRLRTSLRSSCGLPSKSPVHVQSGRLLSQPIKIKRKSTPHKRNNGSKCQPHEIDSQLYQ